MNSFDQKKKYESNQIYGWETLIFVHIFNEIDEFLLLKAVFESFENIKKSLDKTTEQIESQIFRFMSYNKKMFDALSKGL